MKKKTCIIVKVGTNLLTLPTGNLDLNSLRNIAFQCVDIKEQENIHIVLVSSGAITCGKEALQMPCKEIAEKQAAAAVGQIHLCHHYQLFFKEKGCQIGQLLLTKEGFEDAKRKQYAKQTLITLLNAGIIPIVNENDSVAIDEINFGDNDQLAANVAQLLNASQLIYLSNIDGVYQDIDNPKSRIKHITTLNSSFIEKFSKTADTNSKGGMYSKLLASKPLIEQHIRVTIANGREPQILRRILKGEEIGTKIGNT